MAEQVLHEIQGCNALALLSTQGGRSDIRDFESHSADWWRAEGLLQSFLIHLRALDDFFYLDVIEADKAVSVRRNLVELSHKAVTALEFVKDRQSWLEERPLRSTLLRLERTRINRTSIHLDWARLKSGWDEAHNAFSGEQSWRPWDGWDALVPTINMFLVHADDAALSAGFRDEVKRALVDKSVRWQ